MSPMQCASLMMRNNTDPGLIAAYLRLELERDPTIGMTPMERIGHTVEGVMRQIARAFGVPASLLSPPRRGEFTLAGPGRSS